MQTDTTINYSTVLHFRILEDAFIGATQIVLPVVKQI